MHVEFAGHVGFFWLVYSEGRRLLFYEERRPRRCRFRWQHAGGVTTALNLTGYSTMPRAECGARGGSRRWGLTGCEFPREFCS